MTGSIPSTAPNKKAPILVCHWPNQWLNNTFNQRWMSQRLSTTLAIALSISIVGCSGKTNTPTNAPTIPPAQNFAEAIHLNNRGIGHMEQYNYLEAESLFQQVVEKAPTWTVGRINLAIALLNQNTPESLKKSVDILREILKNEPENPHAHYCLAVILNQSGDPEATEHFEAVTKIDPTDPHAWYNLAKSLEAHVPDSTETVREFLQKAVDLAPALSSAVYGLAMLERRAGDIEAATKLLERHTALQSAHWADTAEVKYGLMGRYADVIGRDEKPRSIKTGPMPLFEPVDALQVTLAEGTRWSNENDFRDDAVAQMRGRIRERFGVTSVTLDYNGDGNTDILLLGAVVRNGHVEDLLLQHDGQWKFTDVTADTGLAGPQPSIGCAVGDFDNDGRPDLFIAGAGASRLLRNDGERFEDVTASAATDPGPMISVSATFVDLDQDGDLDLYVSNYTTLDHAAAAFSDEPSPMASNIVFRNDGKARAVAADTAGESGGAPLEIAFQPVVDPAELLIGEHSIGVVPGDFDNDRDVDLCLLQDRGPLVLILNDRLMQFHRQIVAEETEPSEPTNGAIASDFDKNGKLDLCVISPSGPARLLLNQGNRGAVEFKAGAINAEGLKQGRLVDIDLDGWFDLAATGRSAAVLVHNEVERLTLVADALKVHDAPLSGTLWAAVFADFDGDGPADLIEFAGDSPRATRNLGNDNHWVKLKLTGMRDVGKEMRTNRDGVAARFTLHAADLWVEAEQGSQAAGLGAAYEPVLVGLGPRYQLDVIRVRWPDGTLQAEMGHTADRLITLGQEQRKPISCPLLFTWNGTRFEYIGDFLGGGGLGYLLAPGVYNIPDRDESVKIESGMLAPNDGRFVMKIAEPMDEVTYLDHLELAVIDHPAEWTVFPNERFAPLGARPDWRLFAYREPIMPQRVTDMHNQDLTETLRHWDRRVANAFKLRGAWIGYAEEHWITLDFGDRLSRFNETDPLVLYLAGWVEYPFSETNYAAATAGVRLQMPTIERLTDDGKWEAIIPDAGIPAGSPKMMTLDVTGKLYGPRCVLRIRTNMQVYWDQIFAAPVEDLDRLLVHTLPVIDAELGYRGHIQEFSPDGRHPTVYDYHRVDAVPLVRQAGRHTRYGNVLPLLTGDDDCFVIFGAGDEVTVDFDATKLPPIPNGMKRCYVLRSWGYCKSADVMTAYSDTVEPLPFRDMTGYPYSLQKSGGDRASQTEYHRQFNTRMITE